MPANSIIIQKHMAAGHAPSSACARLHTACSMRVMKACSLQHKLVQQMQRLQKHAHVRLSQLTQANRN
jgi:hypothetical protein